MKRKETRKVKVGDIYIGGDSRITVQSMTNTDTRDVSSTVEQILRLEESGCDIVRCAVPDMEAAEAIKEIVKQIHIPLVADIHFDYRLALKSIENGVSKLRINPGNIGDISRVEMVAKAAKRLSHINKNIKVAIMGCVVNGPGEAREADVGIAGGNGEGLIFRKGEIVRKVKEEDLLDELIKEIESL